MQAISDIASPDAVAVSRVDAHRAAINYVARQIDPVFEVVSGVRLQRSSHGRERWQFVIRCEHGLLDAIEVDAQTGEVIPLTQPQIKRIRERADTIRRCAAAPTFAAVEFRTQTAAA